MKTFSALVVLGWLGAMPVWAQANGNTEPAKQVASAAADSATLAAILAEVRGIHNDVRLSETTQILLTEMEVQQGVVDKALAKRDSAKQRMQQMQDQEKAVTEQIARFDENANNATDPQQKKIATQMEEQMKQQLALVKVQEADHANDVTDTEIALRKEQDTLSGIQDQLNAVVRKLQP